MKIFLGILIGIVLILTIKTAYATSVSSKEDMLEIQGVGVGKFTDGNIVCYVASNRFSAYSAAISCLKK